MTDELAQKALFMSAYIMMEGERYGLAYNIYQRCAQLNPNISEIWSNMGMCLEEVDPNEARKCFRKARKLKPNNPHAIANEGLMCLQMADPDQCIALSQKALEIEPIRAAVHNLGLAHLMKRNWAEGWKYYTDTLGVKHREGRDYGLPEWNGEPGLVVVYGEQGVGDEIMFASCLNDIPNDIILDCDKRLEGLFKRSFDFPVYGTRFERETPLLDNHAPQYQCAIGQLPSFYRNSEDSFPGTPYLKPDPERALQWRALFDTFPGKKIGLAWNGGLPNTGVKKRSLKVEDLAPVMKPGNTYINIDYKDSAVVFGGMKAYPRATAKGLDMDELAALVSQLDMVICPCTTAVYVAGALGVECHTLVPKQPGYRYPLEGHFPWYRSVTLHRQQGSWLNTVGELDKHLHRLRSAGNSGISRSVPFDTAAIQSAG